jgi:hypothetical protein
MKAHRAKPLKVMLVDEDPDRAADVRAALVANGCEVTSLLASPLEIYAAVAKCARVDSRAMGTLNRLSTAFSRDQSQKIYVQHRMIERAADIWAWLAEGAHFYVCGDAKRMAADVDAALKEIVAEQGKMDAATPSAYVKQLAKDGRYSRDVY